MKNLFKKNKHLIPEKLHNKTAIVGGYVRDTLMGLEPKDIDFVVWNTSEQEMLDLGFKRVGKDFAVFIDNNGNEFALARLECSTGDKYTDFETIMHRVSLEEDLKRRDLTINAMAITINGLVDPYNGLSDLELGIIRHTSEAFMEDPLRILRVARFLTRYNNFAINEDTLFLLKNNVHMLKNINEVRASIELRKILTEDTPSVFFYFLKSIGADKFIYQDIFLLSNVPQDEKWHAEGNAFIHTMMVIDNSEPEPLIRIGALFHDILKYDSFIEHGNMHFHNDISKKRLEKLAKKYNFSKKEKTIVELTIKLHLRIHHLDIKNKNFARNFTRIIFSNSKIKHDKNLFFILLKIADADARGRLILEDSIIIPGVSTIDFHKFLNCWEIIRKTKTRKNVKNIRDVLINDSVINLKQYLCEQPHG